MGTHLKGQVLSNLGPGKAARKCCLYGPKESSRKEFLGYGSDTKEKVFYQEKERVGSLETGLLLGL